MYIVPIYDVHLNANSLLSLSKSEMQLKVTNTKHLKYFCKYLTFNFFNCRFPRQIKL